MTTEQQPYPAATARHSRTTARSGPVRPETARPDSFRPEAPRSETALPEALRAEAPRSQSAPPNARRPEAPRSRTARPEAPRSQTARPAPARSRADRPDAFRPASERSEEGRSEPVRPQRTPRDELHRKPNWLGGLGTALGLSAAGVAFVPDWGFLGWPLAGLGLAAGIAGIVLASKGIMRGLGVALTGTTLAALAALLCGAMALYPSMFGTARAGDLHIPPQPGEKHSVDYVVSSAGGATVRYGTLNDQRTASSPPSTDDWHGLGSFNGGMPILSLTADTANAGVTNQISCQILVDGKKVAENSGTSIALCTANVG